MAFIVAKCFKHGGAVFLCNVVVNHETKFVMMNACGEVISVAKHNNDFIPSSLIELSVISNPKLYQYHITDTISNVAIIDMPDTLLSYMYVYDAERMKFDFQFNQETIVKTPKNAAVMFEAMNKKKRTLMLQSFSRMKSAVNGVYDILLLYSRHLWSRLERTNHGILLLILLMFNYAYLQDELSMYIFLGIFNFL